MTDQEDLMHQSEDKPRKKEPQISLGWSIVIIVSVTIGGILLISVMMPICYYVRGIAPAFYEGVTGDSDSSLNFFNCQILFEFVSIFCAAIIIIVGWATYYIYKIIRSAITKL